MKIAVLGATGRTGRELLGRALAAGHDVIALVRDPARLELAAPRLKVVTVDARDARAVAEGIAGVDAVLSALGPVKGGPSDAMSRIAASVVAAMERRGIGRLVWLTGAGVIHPEDGRSGSRGIIRFLMKLISPAVLADSEAAFRAITGSTLDWTVVRVPMLKDGPAAGGLTAGTRPPKPRPVARADVAAFMLSQLDDRAWVRRSPLVSA